MMRKDVKLGFAIGGVLLAVLVVYVLVGTGDSGQPTAGQTGAGIVTEDTSGGGKISPDKLADANSTKLPDSSPTANNSGVATPGTNGATASNPPANVASANDPNAKQNDANDLWNTALNQGQLLLTKTPDAPPRGGDDPSQIPARATPTGNGEDIKGTTSNTGTLANNGGVANVPSNAPHFMRGNEVGRGVPTPTDAGSNAGTNTGASGTTGSAGTSGVSSTPDNTSTASSSNDARPALGAGQREHVVQRGETLSLIAQAAYGNANFYPAILRANPNLDPKRMRPGTTIILPAMSEVRPDASSGNASSSTPGGALSPSLASSSSEPAVDSQSEYRVQSNDSLYRISMKLYGRADMVDKLYALNRETIGSDPAKLKVNMLLKLPEPPTQAASR